MFEPSLTIYLWKYNSFDQLGKLYKINDYSGPGGSPLALRSCRVFNIDYFAGMRCYRRFKGALNMTLPVTLLIDELRQGISGIHLTFYMAF